ncbi:hypothetical protein ACWFPY_27915 [Nocardia fluminea]
MRRIKPQKPPNSYVTYRAKGAGFSEMSADPAIRRALWDEQRGRCAYCERVLRDPSRPDHLTRIEHFHPQRGSSWGSDCGACTGAGSSSDAQTKWTNLLLCCDGSESAGANFTCDKSKNNRHVCEDFRNPKLWHSESLVCIERSGKALPATGLPSDADRVVNAALNLNARHLVDVRREIISARAREINKLKARNRGLNIAQRTLIATNLRKEAETAEYPSVLLMLANWVIRDRSR